MKTCVVIILFLASLCSAAQEPQSQAQTQTRPAALSVYHHPTGLEFRYPADWVIQESSIGETELIPADQQKNEKGITEGFLLWGIGGNFEGPVDVGLSGYLNALVTKMAPFLKQDGDPKSMDAAAGPAMTVSWSGDSEDGVKVTARTFSVLHGSFAFVLVMMGSQERMAARDAVMREIFASFRFVQGARDPALAGGWQSPAAGSQTQPSGDSEISMELRPDGHFELQAPGAASEGEGRISGTWYAADGRVCFVYPDSFFLYFRYEVGGAPGSRKLTLHHSSGATQILVETHAGKKKG